MPLIKRTIKIESSQIELLRDMQDVATAYNKSLAKINAEYEARRQALLDDSNDRGRVLWEQLVVRHGISVDESWHKPNWQLDMTYLDTHGDAYLCEFNMPGSAQMGEAFPAASASQLPKNKIN